MKHIITATLLALTATSALATDSRDTTYHGECYITDADTGLAPSVLHASIDWDGNFTLTGESTSPYGFDVNLSTTSTSDPSSWSISPYIGKVNHTNVFGKTRSYEFYWVDWVFGGQDVHLEGFAANTVIYQCDLPYIAPIHSPDFDPAGGPGGL